MPIAVGISPCPNDTFMFYHLITSNQFDLDLSVADVEELNQRVLHHELDISKVSLFTALAVQDHYNLLDVGATLGKNCGPLLVAQERNRDRGLEDARVGIPGRSTTAHLLFSLFGRNQGEKVFMPFHQIMPAVRDGLIEFGVIIHEGRFTYRGFGLAEVVDLGKWWEETYGVPTPLGGIVARRTLAPTFVTRFTQALRDSIKKALKEKEDHHTPLYGYIRRYAQEMDSTVLEHHINLYVGEYSLSLGEYGREAIQKLFDVAHGYRL